MKSLENENHKKVVPYHFLWTNTPAITQLIEILRERETLETALKNTQNLEWKSYFALK